MDLNTLWFILIATLYVGYFVLEGFDFGVGILLPFVAKSDSRRRMVINTIGPHWDGNEVYLITAGGATFAAFPDWYATLFSGFYLPLFLMLMALILRGVALEFRSKDENPKWRAFWDWAIFGGSLLPAFLWGVAFTNFVKGVPIDAVMNYAGPGFWELLSPFALIGGVLAVGLFILHGALYLSLKTEHEFAEGMRQLAGKAWIPVLVILVLSMSVAFLSTDISFQFGINPSPAAIVALIALAVAGYFIKVKKNGWAFGMTALTILLLVAALFLEMYPRVLISSLNPAWSLDIYNASSSPYTLKVMSIVALIFVPLVLIYQGWTYWLFRKRITQKTEDLHY